MRNMEVKLLSSKGYITEAHTVYDVRVSRLKGFCEEGSASDHTLGGLESVTLQDPLNTHPIAVAHTKEEKLL